VLGPRSLTLLSRRAGVRLPGSDKHDFKKRGEEGFLFGLQGAGKNTRRAQKKGSEGNPTSPRGVF